MTHECQCSPTLRGDLEATAADKCGIQILKAAAKMSGLQTKPLERYPNFWGKMNLPKPLGSQIYLAKLSLKIPINPYLQGNLHMKLLFSGHLVWRVIICIYIYLHRRKPNSQAAELHRFSWPLLGSHPQNRGMWLGRGTQKTVSLKIGCLASMGNINNISASNCPLS